MNQNIEKCLDLVDVGNSLLDLGCGDGKITMKIAKKMKAKEIHGIDLDEGRLKKAKKRGIDVHNHDITTKLPFKEGTFDIVFSNGVMEYVYNVDYFLKEIRRVLKPGGCVVISITNMACWPNILALTLGFQDFTNQGPSDEYVLGNPLKTLYKGDLNQRGPYLEHKKTIFTLRSLKEIFQVHGFDIQVAVGVGYVPFCGGLSNMFSRIDPIHSYFILVKAKKKVI